MSKKRFRDMTVDEILNACNVTDNCNNCPFENYSHCWEDVFRDCDLDAKISTMTPLEALSKLDNTICLNSQSLKFKLDDDEHIDCESIDEAIECIDIVKRALTQKDEG